MKRSAKAIWNGNLKEGKGQLSTQSQALSQTPYTFVSRFDEGKGTNPEELIAAAHAGCFTMKLNADLSAAGYLPTQIETTAEVTLIQGIISQSALSLNANVPGLTLEDFQNFALEAKANCPVSKVLNLEITLNIQSFNGINI
ncbi:peroxiredoxin, OsmC subfamily [Leadbetterella byssophila DSM 17132]|uniref:Peroxiredoxin, OsmC subfamily n=1 Tax=Leadbetterella byssophila (strain DSM 17132 / JCM 16389 / KACC 11308 / NBRC 106382 / 4M15) TaxID=649349 RepID=E4RZU4_LEAB4|nr:OsmC family protein [Leadbetterella byssophila]ADQ19236.1 peroxiredoxin, OsmC subfamily [Leadbetterella byssophila DSM 17132]